MRQQFADYQLKLISQLYPIKANDNSSDLRVDDATSIHH